MGCATQFCALLTDWNIPHRGLASLQQDSCLSLQGEQQFFDNCSLFIIWKRVGGFYMYGHFVHLQDTLISFIVLYRVIHISGCQWVNQALFFFFKLGYYYYYYTGIFHSLCCEIRTVKAYGAHENGVWLFLCSQKTSQADNACSLSFFVWPAFYSDGLFSDSKQVSSALCACGFLF